MISIGSFNILEYVKKLKVDVAIVSTLQESLES